MSAMFKKTGSAALIGLLAMAPMGAFAQSNSDATTEEDGTATTTVPADDGTMATDGSATEGTMNGDGEMATDSAEMETEEEPAQPVEGQIVMQDENTILAEDLLGSQVYSQEGESIGEINDMIVDLDGSIQGIVIGVGGFLGIGEKSVAVEMSSLSTQTDENGDVQLVTSATAEDLEAAEAFVSASEQEAMNENQEAAEGQGQTMSGDSGTGSGMATSGDTGMATTGETGMTTTGSQGDAAEVEGETTESQ